MEEFDLLKESWNKITTDAAINSKEIFKTKNTTIMKSILNYEKNEKDEKRKQIIAMIFSTSMFVLIFAYWNFTEQVELSIVNISGALLLAIAFGLSIITNKTDDFPDARLLNTKEYLKELKDNVESRRKRHLMFSYISILIIIPGLFLLFDNVKILETLDLPFMNIVVIISALSGFIGGMILWRKNYEQATSPLLKDIEILNKEIQEVE